MSFKVDNLYRETEDRLGLYFKICTFLNSLVLDNYDYIVKYNNIEVLRPLEYFPKLNRVKTMKDKLMRFAVTVKGIVYNE